MCEVGDSVVDISDHSGAMGGRYSVSLKSGSKRIHSEDREDSEGSGKATGDSGIKRIPGRVLEVFTGAKEALAYVLFPGEKPRWAFVSELEVVESEGSDPEREVQG